MAAKSSSRLSCKNAVTFSCGVRNSEPRQNLSCWAAHYSVFTISFLASQFSRPRRMCNAYASVAATGICLRDNLDDHPAFECYSGVLRPKRSRASMLLKQNPNLQKEAFDEYGRRRSSFPTVLAHNGAMGGKRLSGLQQPSNQDNVRLMSIYQMQKCLGLGGWNLSC